MEVIYFTPIKTTLCIQKVRLEDGGIKVKNLITKIWLEALADKLETL